MGSSIHQLAPSKIRFTQDSIKNTFEKPGPHQGKLIGQTLDELCEGVCRVYNIPRIRAFERDGHWWSSDNRRLWVFREYERLGGCHKVPVKVIEISGMDEAKLTTKNEGKDVRVRGDWGDPGGQWHSKARGVLLRNRQGLWNKGSRLDNHVPTSTRQHGLSDMDNTGRSRYVYQSTETTTAPSVTPRQESQRKGNEASDVIRTRIFYRSSTSVSRASQKARDNTKYAAVQDPSHIFPEHSVSRRGNPSWDTRSNPSKLHTEPGISGNAYYQLPLPTPMDAKKWSEPRVAGTSTSSTENLCRPIVTSALYVTPQSGPMSPRFPSEDKVLQGPSALPEFRDNVYSETRNKKRENSKSSTAVPGFTTPRPAEPWTASVPNAQRRGEQDAGNNLGEGGTHNATSPLIRKTYPPTTVSGREKQTGKGKGKLCGCTCTIL